VSLRFSYASSNDSKGLRVGTKICGLSTHQILALIAPLTQDRRWEKLWKRQSVPGAKVREDGARVGIQ
jgi:hypothetical protein